MTSLFAADGPAMLHVEQDPELLVATRSSPPGAG